MKKRPTLSDFRGTWQVESEDTLLVIEISEKRGKPHIEAWDKSDGERFKIRKLTFKDGVLGFDLLVPSTGHKTVNRFTLKSDQMLKQELTLIEYWTRMDKDK